MKMKKTPISTPHTHIYTPTLYRVEKCMGKLDEHTVCTLGESYVSWRLESEKGSQPFTAHFSFWLHHTQLENWISHFGSLGSFPPFSILLCTLAAFSNSIGNTLQENVSGLSVPPCVQPISNLTQIANHLEQCFF